MTSIFGPTSWRTINCYSLKFKTFNQNYIKKFSQKVVYFRIYKLIDRSILNTKISIDYKFYGFIHYSLKDKTIYH